MSVKRPFASLNVSELQRLLKLVFDRGLHADELHTDEMSSRLWKRFGVLAADLGFELWLREHARVEARVECGRLVRGGQVQRGELRH